MAEGDRVLGVAHARLFELRGPIGLGPIEHGVEERVDGVSVFGLGVCHGLPVHVAAARAGPLDRTVSGSNDALVGESIADQGPEVRNRERRRPGARRSHESRADGQQERTADTDVAGPEHAGIRIGLGVSPVPVKSTT